jgi:hypothetical protein
MFHNAVHRRTLSMFLVFCMVMDISQFAGIPAFAKADTGGIIFSFQKLPSSVSSQMAALGTSQSGVNLPDTLTVTVRLEPEAAKSKPVPDSGESESSSAVLSDVVSDTGGRQKDAEPESAAPSENLAASSAVCPDTASDTGGRQKDTEPESAAPSESPAALPANTGDAQPDSSVKAAVSDTVTREIPVTWVSSPDYDGNTAGKYEFTPVMPDGYSLEDGVELPEITVTVEKSAGTITAFEKLADSVRWQRTASPELPTSVKGTVGGKSVDIPVAWQADHDFDIASPEKGLYVFTAQPDGYTAANGVELPRVAVYVPKTSGLLTMLLRSIASPKADLSIETAAQLSELAVLVNDGRLESFITGNNSGTVSVELENDIDLSGYGEDYNGGKGWTPIGKYVDEKNDIPFKGTFDGGNHTVTGLYINDSSLNATGLFGVVNGTVKNLNLSDVNISGNNGVGGVTGSLSGGTVQNCYLTGAVNGSKYVGGIVGKTTRGVVQSCCSTCTVVSSSAAAGGIAGGLDSGGMVQNCYSTGVVNGSWYVGGIVGIVVNSSTVQKCYSTSIVNGSKFVGGAAGSVESEKSVVKRCAALNPSVTGNQYTVGRVAGDNGSSWSALSANCAWSGMTVNGKSVSSTNISGLDGGDASAKDIQGSDDFWTATVSFDSSVWTIENNKLPVLKNVSGEQDSSIPVYILTSSFQPFLGSGTSNDPYQISSAGQLAKLAALVNAGNTAYNDKYYQLTCDLDLSAYGKNYNGGKGWIPIGMYVDGNTNDISFKGTFDGVGHTVTGLYINDSSLKGTGLFGCTDGGTVKNCRFTGAVSGRDYVGSAVGYMKNNSTMENCSSACTVNGLSDIGGVAGYVESGTLQNCCSTGAVTSSGTGVGGVAGIVNGTMTNCYSSGKVKGGSFVGGVAGNFDGTMTNCYFTGAIRGYNYTGGVTGMMSSGKVQNCAALSPSITDTDTNSIGRVNGYNFNRRGNFSGNYAWSGMTVNGKSVSCSNAGGTNGADASASDIQSASFWTGTLGFDGSVWTIADNKLPVLKNVPGDQDNSIPLYILAASSKPFLGGGTKNDPYQISSAEQLAELASLVNTGNTTYNSATYKLTCDFDLSAYGKNYNGGKGWVPIGSNGHPFKGTFDGGGYTITGLYINNSSLTYVGLFGYLVGSIVDNLRLSDASVTGNEGVGDMAGMVIGSSSKVQNCCSTGTVTGSKDIGGMVGCFDSGIMQNCYSTSTVSGSSYAGGIIGTVNSNAKVLSCDSTGAVKGNSYVGGVAGSIEGDMENCAALNPSVSGSSFVGRVAGQNFKNKGTLSGSYAWSGMTGGGSSKTADGLDGADVSPETILSGTAFWTDTLSFSSDNWTIEDNRLPILKSISGTQSGAPGLYLMPKNITYASLTKTLFTYNGALQKPGVKFGDITLTEGKDYSIEITSTDDSGTSAGTNAGNVAITLNGKGNYDGTKTVTYSIGKVPMSNVTLSGTQFTYNGALQKTGVKFGDTTLTEGTDYSIKITSADGDDTSAGTNVGTVSITLTGKGNCTGTTTANYTISKVPLTITNATVSNKTCDGTAAATVGNVKLSGFINNETLTLNQDYTVSGTFSDAQIGTNKQVLVTVTMLNTAKANHYAVPGVYVCRANINNDHSSSDDNTNTGTALPVLLTDAATGVEADISGAAFPLSVNGVTLSATRPKISGASADPQGAAAYRLAVSSTDLNIVGSPALYSLKLLNQNGSTISSFTGSVIVKLPVPVGIHGTPRVFRREPDGTFTDMNAKVENGYLVFRTTHFSYYIVAGTGDSVTLDTKSYEMPLGGEYRIGVKQTGKKNVALKVRSTNSGVAAARLVNGSVQVNGTGVGTAWIILDVFDDKNKLLAHVSTRIDVKTGIRPRGDSTRQIAAYTVRDTADSLTLDTKSYELTIGGKYQIGAWLTGGKAVTVRYCSANNKIASVTKLPNGNYQVTGKSIGTTSIIFGVYDNKNKLLTRVSTQISVKNGIQPIGDSVHQVGIF